MEFRKGTAGYTLSDHSTNEDVFGEVKIDPVENKLSK
jgi:hypothetical protein